MVSFVTEFLALYDMEYVLVVDGCPYAPVEQLAYSVTRALTFHYLSILLICVLVFVLGCFGIWFVKKLFCK